MKHQITFRLLAVLLLMVLVGAIFPGTAVGAPTEMKFTIDSQAYYVNGVKANMDTAPVIMENRTLIPIGYVAQPLGAQVEWNQADQQVRVTLKKQTVELWIGKNTAKINGQEVLIDPQNPKVVPIILPPGRTMLPLSFVATALGANLGWNESLLQITVTYPAQRAAKILQPTQANVEATKEFASYDNYDWGFGLKYPADWTITEKVMAFVVLLKSPDYNNIVTVSIFAKKDLGDFVAAQLENFRMTMPGFILVESSSITRSGLPAHKLVYTYNSNVGVLKLMSIYIAVDDHIFMITYGGQISDFKTNLPAGELIIDSMTI